MIYCKVQTCKECEEIEFIGRDDYPYCYEMFRLGWGVRRVPLDSISNLCPLKETMERKVKEE